jgi:hypothetical protein
VMLYDPSLLRLDHNPFEAMEVLDDWRFPLVYKIDSEEMMMINKVTVSMFVE